jgi:hypothetical protein
MLEVMMMMVVMMTIMMLVKTVGEVVCKTAGAEGV